MKTPVSAPLQNRCLFPFRAPRPLRRFRAPRFEIRCFHAPRARFPDAPLPRAPLPQLPPRPRQIPKPVAEYAVQDLTHQTTGPILLKPPAAPKCQAVPTEAGHLAAADTSGRGTAGATECEHAGTPLLAHTNLAGLGKPPMSPAHSVTFRTMDTPPSLARPRRGRNVNV